MLALGILSALGRALDFIASYDSVVRTIQDIPREDPATYKMFSRGDSVEDILYIPSGVKFKRFFEVNLVEFEGRLEIKKHEREDYYYLEPKGSYEEFKEKVDRLENRIEKTLSIMQESVGTATDVD